MKDRAAITPQDKDQLGSEVNLKRGITAWRVLLYLGVVFTAPISIPIWIGSWIGGNLGQQNNIAEKTTGSNSIYKPLGNGGRYGE